MKRIFASESVTEGHPDKVCDQISDAILDAILAQDPSGRVACECCCTSNFLLIMGEITTTANVDIEKIARATIKNIGYDRKVEDFNFETCEIKVLLNKQSPDIALGVDVEGAGDQGMMFGYACLETEEYMPLALQLSHKLCERLAFLRKSGTLPYLRPDGKAQIAVEYGDNGEVSRIDNIVVSTQHTDDVSTEVLRADILKHCIKAVVPSNLIDSETLFHINPTGRFVVGGPAGDSGLTGRKIIVDTYGGYAPHGGGCFSGKDPTKVDRSAAYFARYAAKNIVAAGLAKRCSIQVAYAIGRAEPVSIDINTSGTGKFSDEILSGIVKKLFDFRPKAIINALNLRKPIYSNTACYGHFGKDAYSWEKCDKVEELRKALSDN